MAGVGGEFHARVREVLLRLRPGEVVTYGEVAEEAGSPRAAQSVGNFLARNGDHHWWRVVTVSGRLAPGKEEEQARRLREEGVRVEGTRVQRRRA